MTIHFNADLRPIVGKRVGMLHWITDPAASGFLIGYDLSGNQVLISNFDVSVDHEILHRDTDIRTVRQTSSGDLERGSLPPDSQCSYW